MAKANRLRFRVPFYLIPLVLGMCGVLFSRQLTDPLLRGAVLLVSVSLPIFVAGNILARLHMKDRERLVLFVGIILLTLGAAVTVSGFTESIIRMQDVRAWVAEVSRGLGLFSLMIGVVAVVVILFRSDEAIEQTGERFKQLAEQIGEGFILTGADGRIAMVNQRLLDITGLREEEIIGRNARVLAEDLKIDTMLPHIDNRWRGVASEYEINWNRNQKQARLLINGAPIFNRKGELAGALATVRDITEQHRMAKRLETYAESLQKQVNERTTQLQRSESRLRELLLTMREGFLTIDSKCVIEFANEHILAMLGVERESLITKDLFLFVDAAGRQMLLDLLEAAHSHRDERIQREICLLRSDGSLMPAVAAVAPIRDPAAHDIHYSLVLTDIAELKRMQHQLEIRANELETANEELKMLDRAKDSLLSNISHELRTPLSTIRGYIEMLNSDLGPLSAQQGGALSVMSRNVERLGQLIEQIIQFSRMEIRGFQPVIGLFSIGELLNDCAAAIKPRLNSRMLELAIDIDHDVDLVWGDRKGIEQLLGILLSNALKFSNENGAIKITAQRRGESDLRICVRDEGIGIERTHHRRIFDKFFQVDGSLSRRYEGVGIGLSIAKTIVEAHRGKIEVESEPMHGSTFTAIFPRSLLNTAYAPDDANLISNLAVLVAVDDAPTLHAVRQMIEHCSSTAHGVTNGYECIRAALEHRFDVIVIDQVMRESTGLATCDKLRQYPKTRDIPVLILLDGPHPPRETFEIDSPPAFLNKPFTGSELARKIQQIMGRVSKEPPALEEASESWSRMRPSVLIMDSDTDLLDWVATALDLKKVSHVCLHDPNRIEEALSDFVPDVVFADVDTIKKTDGEMVEALHHLRSVRGIPIYGMTCMPESTAVANCCDGFLQKPFPIRAMLDIVFALHERAVK